MSELVCVRVIFAGRQKFGGRLARCRGLAEGHATFALNCLFELLGLAEAAISRRCLRHPMSLQEVEEVIDAHLVIECT